MHNPHFPAQTHLLTPSFYIPSFNLYLFTRGPSLGFLFRRNRRPINVLLPGVYRNLTTQGTVSDAGSVKFSKRSSPSLGSFSARVRELLSKFPKTTKQKVSQDIFLNERSQLHQRRLTKEQEAAEEDLLMWLSTFSNVSETAELHPLLCVRVLERLGYAVYHDSPEEGGWIDSFRPIVMSSASITEHSGPAFSHQNLTSSSTHSSRPGGWLSRHASLSLTTQPLRLRSIVERVLFPLQDLMGHRSRNLRAHPQVIPVIPIALEWWCTLPYSSRLPVSKWVPQLATFYSSLSTQPQRSGQNQTEGFICMDAGLPSITFLLPYFTEKVRFLEPAETYLSHKDQSLHSNGFSKIKTPKICSSTNTIQEALVELFTLSFSSRFPVKPADKNADCTTGKDNNPTNDLYSKNSVAHFESYQTSGHSFSGPRSGPFECITSYEGQRLMSPWIIIQDPLLVSIFFWQGTSPLVAFRLISFSLYKAILLFSLHDTQRSNGEDVIGEPGPSLIKDDLRKCQSENESRRGPKSCSYMHVPDAYQVSVSALILRVFVDDDNTFRRLLLRLSSKATGSIVSDLKDCTNHKYSQERDSREADRIVNLIEPVASFRYNLDNQERSCLRSMTFTSRTFPSHDELAFSNVANKATLSEEVPQRDRNAPLRCINPLYDYLIATYAAQPPCSAPYPLPERFGLPTQQTQSSLKLSFMGVVSVLSAALKCLGQLRNESCCANAVARTHVNSYHNGENVVSKEAAKVAEAHQMIDEFGEIRSDAFTLLPEKQRVHRLKEICELLLNRSPNHCFGKLQRQPTVEHGVTSDADHLDSQYPINVEPWFIDVPLAHQGAILRRMCGACRALVRVVMEEKRCSLLLEGPDGAATSASGASSSLLSQNESFAAWPFCQDRSSESNQAFTQVLRNTAFRILEPTLWWYYIQCKEWEPQLLDFKTLQAVCDALFLQSKGGVTKVMDVCHSNASLSSLLQSLKHSTPAARAADEAFLSTVFNVDKLCVTHLLSLCEAMKTVYRNMGGPTAWKTARLVLCQPMHQPIHAVIEGLRLTCLHILLFYNTGETHNAQFSNPSSLLFSRSKANECGREPKKISHAVDEIGEHVLLEVVEAFFCVWKLRTETGITEDHAFQDDALQSTGTTTHCPSQSISTPENLIFTRLLLLVFLTLQRYLLHKRNEDTDGYQEHDLNFGRDATHIAFRSLRELLPCQGSETSSEWALTNWPDLVEMFQASNDTCDDKSWLHLGSNGLPYTFHDVTPKITRWELAEELQTLGIGEQTSECLRSPMTWYWLGTPAAVRRAARALRRLPMFPGNTGSTYYFLLPWSTLALAQHPLRLYDEGGQSSRAVEVFGQELQSLFSTASKHLSHNRAEGEKASTPRVVVRLVSAAEEIQHFAALGLRGDDARSVMILADDIQVVNPEVVLEETLRVWQQNSGKQSEHIDLDGVQNEGEEYDGLD